MLATLEPVATSPAPVQEVPAQPAMARYYHPELDGLRFLACLGVFILHCYPFALPKVRVASAVIHEVQAWYCSLFNAGVAGVDLFFVLSSFLITELLLRERERTGRIDVRAFYVRRALRIWPLYYVFLTLAVLLEPLVAGGTGQALGMTAVQAAGFYAFIGNWVAAFSPAKINSVAIILWTVSIEEQFYLVWPALMRWITPKRLLLTSLTMIAIATVTRTWLVLNDADLEMLKANTFARLDSLAAGALLALALRRWKLKLSSEARWMLFAAGLFTMVATCRYLRLEPMVWYAELLTFPLWSLASVMLMLSVYRQDDAADPPSLLASAPLVYLGRISYGIYVWHMACIVALASCGLMRRGDLLIGFYALPLSIAVAALSYHLLEKPFLRLKDAWAVVPSRSES